MEKIKVTCSNGKNYSISRDAIVASYAGSMANVYCFSSRDNFKYFFKKFSGDKRIKNLFPSDNCFDAMKKIKSNITLLELIENSPSLYNFERWTDV